jgi:hemerythrin-like metal-binding protein
MSIKTRLFSMFMLAAALTAALTIVMALTGSPLPVVVAGAVVTALVLIGGYITTVSLSTQLDAVVRAFEALSKNGDLAARIESPAGGTKGQLAESFNAFAAGLAASLGQISTLVARNKRLGDKLSEASRAAAEAVAEMNRRVGQMRQGITRLDTDISGASSYIEENMAAINSLAAQVEHQFAAIARSSSSIEQIMASVGNVARVADARMAAMAELVSLIAQGGQKVETTTAIIKDIARSAESMSDMIGIINNIASQTNLLAMNASIEAAHAGAAGKGFAVVAGEIRNLAELTGSNAGQIARSLQAVTTNVSLATHAGVESEAVLGEINRGVNSFSKALVEVTTAMNELSMASGEILESINTLVDTSRTVKGASDEMKAGTEEMLRTVHGLRDFSTETLLGVEDLTNHTGELDRVSLQVAAFGNQNQYNNAVLSAEMTKLAANAISTSQPSGQDIGLDWSDMLSVGIPAMDAQHQELFARINKLLRAMLATGQGGDVPGLAAFIGEYVDRHFSDEERLMRDMGFPQLLAHQAAHEAFKKEFRDIGQRVVSETPNAVLLIAIQDKVVDWLLRHIGGADKRYGEYAAARMPEAR